MAASKTGICNMALSALGISIYIANVDTEQSKAANVCRRFYDQVRDAVLEEFDWGFARVSKSLSLATVSFTNWDFSYNLPSDCVAPRSIVNPAVKNVTDESRIPFKMMNSGGSRFIATDMEDAELVYTSRVDDASLFSPSFVTALYYALAAEIAMPMSVSTTIAELCSRKAKAAIDNSVASDASKEQEGPAPECGFISARN